MTDADAICGDRQIGWSATSSRGSEAEEGEPVGLKDGSSVLVRPVTSDDKPLFVAGFARLGEQSRYRRFLAAKKRLSDDDLAFFTELDHHGAEALGAVDPTTGEGLAVARYLRDPARPDVAEAAIAVIDDWQKRGLGTVLLERLAILALFASVGTVHTTGRSGGTEEVDVHLPITPDDPFRLTEALRIAASKPDAISLNTSVS
jgi:GNAT superfamily N-acetyltransferase